MRKVALRVAIPGRSLPVLAAVAVLVAPALAAAVARAAPPNREEILRRAGKVLADPSYQTELPGQEPAAGGAAAGAGPRRRGGGAGPWGDRPSNRSLSTGAEPVIRAVLWALLAITLAAAAVWLLRETARGRRRLALPAAPEPLPADEVPETAAPSLDEAEELARRGAYGDAAHLLLRRAIALVGRRRPFSPALTSREVLLHAGLASPAGEAFGELVAAVERFWFGGAGLRREDYVRCAAAYRAVAAGAEAER